MDEKMMRFIFITFLTISHTNVTDSGRPRGSNQSCNTTLCIKMIEKTANTGCEYQRTKEKNVLSLSYDDDVILDCGNFIAKSEATSRDLNIIPQPMIVSESSLTPSALALNSSLVSYQEKTFGLTEDKSLEGLVKAIIKKDLEECDLIIVTDGSYRGSSILEILVEVPVVKQVVQIDSPEDLAQRIEWKSPRCQGTFLLMSDPQPLIDFGNSYRFRWAYSAKVVIIGLTVQSLDKFVRTTKGKKTEHIIGVVKGEYQNNFKIFMNLLYWGDGFKLVSNWWGEHFATEAELFPDKITNLRRGVLKVFMFEFEPGMFVTRDSSGKIVGRHGRDVAVIDALADVFNFTLLYVDIPQDWGTLLPNGTFTGLVGLFQKNAGHMGIANLFPSALDNRHVYQDYSTAVHEDRACFIARVEPPLPRWQNISLPFQSTTWLAMLVGLLCSGPLLFLVATATGRNEREDPRFKSPVVSSIYAFAIHVDHPLDILPRCNSTRIFLLFLMLYGLIFTTGYRANLTAFLTFSRHPKSIETVRDIYDAGWTVMGIPWYYTAFKHSENPYLRGLLDRYEFKREFSEAKDQILSGGTTLIMSSNNLQVISSLTTTAKGTPLLRFLKECLSSYSVTIGFPVNSPLKYKFNRILARMFESGLVERWFIQANEKYLRIKKQEEKADSGGEELDSSTDGVIPLGMDHMQGVFIVYAIGFVLSKLSFFIEIISQKCSERWSSTY